MAYKAHIVVRTILCLWDTKWRTLNNFTYVYRNEQNLSVGSRYFFLAATILNTAHSKSLHQVTIMLLGLGTHNSRLQAAWAFLQIFDSSRPRLHALRNTIEFPHSIKHVHVRLELCLAFSNAQYFSEVKSLNSHYAPVFGI